MKSLRAIARLGGIIAAGVPLAVAQGLVMGPIFRDHHTIPGLMHKMVQRMINLSVTVKGSVDHTKQALIAANHLSYLDPSILGGLFRGHFIGKREVGEWPVLGFLIKQFDPILIRRSRTNNSHSHYKLVTALNAGKSIIFFPEATTSDGSGVLKFKAGMFRVLFNQAVDRDNAPLRVEREIAVQPVAIRLTRMNGQDATQRQDLRDIFAWHDDTPMLRHMWNCAVNARDMEVEVTILPTLSPADYETPEDLANAAHQLVSGVINPQQPR